MPVWLQVIGVLLVAYLLFISVRAVIRFTSSATSSENRAMLRQNKRELNLSALGCFALSALIMALLIIWAIVYD